MKFLEILVRNIKKGTVILLVLLSLVGCQTIKDAMLYKPAGDTVRWLAQDHVVPYMLGSNDLAMSCTMSEGMSPLLMSFKRVTLEPNQLAVIMNVAGGACEENRALKYELQYLRAISQNKPDVAEDALIMQKRHLAKAAVRQFEAWKSVNRFYGTIGEGECPAWSTTGSRWKIDPRLLIAPFMLDSEFDQFIYLAGLLSGLQAVNSEIQSTASIGVPKNIGAMVARGAGCLSDDDWWGVPMAMKSLVWVMIPGALPRGEDAWSRLDAADKKGEKAKVRLTHVLHAMALYNKGDMEGLKNLLRKHVAQIKKYPSNPKYRMLDSVATATLTALSDRLWTENTGHRTPMGGMGTFWDDKKASGAEVMDLDDLF